MLQFFLLGRDPSKGSGFFQRGASLNEEDKQQLQQLRQLSLAFQLAIKGTTPTVRNILKLEGFDKTKRIILARHLYNLAGHINRALRRIA